jgi:septin family protein
MERSATDAVIYFIQPSYARLGLVDREAMEDLKEMK